MVKNSILVEWSTNCLAFYFKSGSTYKNFAKTGKKVDKMTTNLAALAYSNLSILLEFTGVHVQQLIGFQICEIFLTSRTLETRSVRKAITTLLTSLS